VNRGVWLPVVIAGGVLVAVAAVVVSLWTEIGDSQISAAGWVAMALGIVLTLALGIGLMALVFISNRRGFDEEGSGR
jgi:hypothetical protein